MVDDVYFEGIKIKSSFRPVLVNQPASEQDRGRFLSQLEKFTLKRDFNSVSTTFLLALVLYFYYIQPVLNEVLSTFQSSSLSSDQVSSLCGFLVPILGLEDEGGIMSLATKECIQYFNLISL